MNQTAHSALQAGPAPAGSDLSTGSSPGQQNLFELDARLHFLADSIAHIVWSTDSSGSLDFANVRWTEFTGEPASAADTDAWFARIHLDDRQSAEDAFWHSIASGNPFAFESRLRRSDGEYRWHLTRGVPYREPAGAIERWVCTATDIDDLKTTVRALRESERDVAMQGHLLEAVQQAIISTDTQGTITSWNRHAEVLYGWTAEEAVGRHIAELLFAEGRSESEPDSSTRPWNLETRVERDRQVRRKDGSVIWVSVSAGPIMDANGNVTHYVGCSVDITERLRLEQEFRQSQKMEAVGRLAGGVAHDFNNLLTVIKGHAEFLSHALPPEGQSREDADQISKAAERAAGLTRQLLAFSRQQVMEKQIIDPNALLLDLEKMLARLIGADIALNVVLPPGIPSVFADPGQVEQAVMNLVVNARDAMPEGGCLGITTRAVTITPDDAARHSEARPGDYVSIAVSDTGSGIPSALMAKIFEPFFTTKATGRGTGLGLATVYGIAQQSGGFVGVTSSLQNGSTFTLYLPASEPGARNKVTRVTPVSTRAQELILLVEDQDEVRAVARRILLTHGYRVIEARNGVDALALLHGIDPGIDLVLTDAVMPHMGGPDLIRALRVKQPDLPVVMASGYTDHELISYGAAELNVPFLHKPFRAEDLLRIVRKSLDGTAN